MNAKANTSIAAPNGKTESTPSPYPFSLSISTTTNVGGVPTVVSSPPKTLPMTSGSNNFLGCTPIFLAILVTTGSKIETTPRLLKNAERNEERSITAVTMPFSRLPTAFKSLSAMKTASPVR